MDIRFDVIEGPFTLRDDLTAHGMITVGVTVPTARSLILHGVITGDLDVQAGGSATVHGIVDGAVRNHGGVVQIFGTVGSVVDLVAYAQTTVAPEAVVSGSQP